MAQVYDAIHLNDLLWRSSLLVITYFDHCGFFDHVVPPDAAPDGFVALPDVTGTGKPFLFDRLGVRVPAIIVSAYVSKGTVDHTIYDHASIPATVRKLFLEREKYASPREEVTNTFDRLLTLKKPRPRSDAVAFGSLQ